jgi:hypothetical protein
MPRTHGARLRHRTNARNRRRQDRRRSFLLRREARRKPGPPKARPVAPLRYR